MQFLDLDIALSSQYKDIADNCSFLSVNGSEYNFAVMYAQRFYEKVKYALFEDSLLISAEIGGKRFFYPPVCRTEKEFVNAVKKCIEIGGNDFSMCCLTKEMYLLLNNNTPLRFTECRDMFEYLYLPESLISYSGKKLHAKRNFLNSFTARYNFKLRGYEPSDLDEITHLIDKWQQTKYSYSDYEKGAIIESLNSKDRLGIICDVMLIEEKICGFIIASSDKNLDANIIYEKADISYKGIYAALMNAFVKKNFSLYRYINMQEDMGIEGLRKSKLSYSPERFIEKYYAEPK